MGFCFKAFYVVAVVIHSCTLLTFSLTIPFSIPLIANLSSDPLPLNASASGGLNDFDPSEIINLLFTLRQRPDIYLNQAKLKIVSFDTLTQAPSRDITDFTFVTPLFEAGGKHSQSAKFNAFTFSTRMTHPPRWLGPDLFSMDPARLAALHELDWVHIQAHMTLGEAASLLRGTGYKQVIHTVQLLQTSGLPLGYAFTFGNPQRSTYLVSITTGEVRRIL